ncbi:hypothetical protein [Terribacillus halophilus]|uniref:hypothetical protein n=1 Tax=Terribacillus halophilus TaxID=361279 RepID=UPI00117C9DBA|nr:hypothetical protein [Terribacillus halophilus]
MLSSYMKKTSQAFTGREKHSKVISLPNKIKLGYGLYLINGGLVRRITICIYCLSGFDSLIWRISLSRNFQQNTERHAL